MPSLTQIIISLPAILIALTFHEYAHGRVADMLGDDTPYYQGRLTLNPLPHIDWIGFVMLMVAGFGWAKPVQVNPLKFKNITMKKGMLMVSLAGPLMNLFLAFIGMVLYRVIEPSGLTEWGGIALTLIQPLIVINLVLAAFNLIPVPPLDGSKILAGLLPDAGANFVYNLERYGPILLLILVFTDTASYIFMPVVRVLYYFLQSIVY